MTYEQVEKYINEIPKFTTKNKPEHTRKFLELLGNPQESFKVIHVAGSNGKGSTCAFCYNVLREAGKSCGLFTSPHLIELVERMQINGQNCSREAFLKADEKVREAVGRLAEMDMPHPTFFEYLFGLGMVIFKDANVEYVVLETGLGGRLDATNVVEHPIMTIITSISLEHTEILGDTIEQIAAEKAGIIKPGVPVVYGGKVPQAAAVIREHARQQGAPAYEVNYDELVIKMQDSEGLDFIMEGAFYALPSPAEYQMENAALAIRALKLLAESAGLTQEHLHEGIINTEWPGRMESVDRGVYFDGAHNPDGIAQFIKTVQQIGGSKPTLLFSMVKEKDYREVVKMLATGLEWKKVFVTQVHGPREIPAAELGDIFRQFCSCDVEVIEDNRKAFEMAFEEPEWGETLFCTGSLYLIGELKRLVKEM